ncbi:hypothetical protein F0U44_13185 [Nocardioides humilatus]|uniref:Thioesterase family protein n=1 Tax=Nocardioides humilatus TaxID=2607660 RepID=A0A5B1LFC3_9ACTN|nr:hypothetical protein [Nocardioides humilatus]KAA1419385.1 hypothetical protein F0U44_13185 [Nocardioides humilatus]
MQPTTTPLIVPQRFHGPPRSGNGGWTAGALAERLTAKPETPVTVALRLPPPLDIDLPIAESETGIAATHEGRTVVEARVDSGELAPVAAATLEEATDAQTRYPGFAQHPFPTCFACGPDRAEGDGLHIFPGRLADDPSRVATVWRPYDVTVPITWAALDCTSGWAAGVDDRPMVLGTMTAQIHRLPVVGEPHVSVGTLRSAEGRKALTASSLYTADGELVATAQQVWIAINPEDFS